MQDIVEYFIISQWGKIKFYRNIGVLFYKNFNKSVLDAKLFLEQLSKGILKNRCTLYNLEDKQTWYLFTFLPTGHRP